MGRRSSGKQERLTAAAVACFHDHGYARTSLAQVAQRAGIPSGNVFYYFRTKDDLARAVVEEWRYLLASYLAPLDAVADPWTRLKKFVDQGAALADVYVAQGCPLASLARDLRQANPSLAAQAPRIYAVQLDWITRQFSLGGFRNVEAKACARTMLARYHGSIHLAYTQGDRSIQTNEARLLKAWLSEKARAVKA